ncbi:TetR family transcriptional regulator C-terminal domain-containing protein [Amycolatopsis sp. cmx-4-68]|uniref:TetR family transcriptional regulator C-terminal domain-containing protein n=1 Tax=Amycolatopsis sp. cmx-4-68 TaxID=2790938 RepID=UPI00397991A5
MDTAERLIESMRELLWERGYVGTSPKDVLARAGAGQGSMYHHFRGKADLAGVAIARNAAAVRAEAAQQLDLTGSAVDRIVTYLLRGRDVRKGCPVGGLTYDPDVVVTPELRRPIDEFFRWLRHHLAELLTEAQAHGELTAALDPAELASTIVAVMQGGYVLARAADDPAQFSHAVSGLRALLAQSRP